VSAGLWPRTSTTTRTASAITAITVITIGSGFTPPPDAFLTG